MRRGLYEARQCRPEEFRPHRPYVLVFARYSDTRLTLREKNSCQRSRPLETKLTNMDVN